VDYPSFSQLSLILKNDTDFKLSKLVDKDYFIVAFVEHMKEHFKNMKKQFSILTPLLDPCFEEEQCTTIFLDEIELGELCLIHNSVTEISSLVYSSSSGLIEIVIFESSDYEETTVSDYLLMMHEFSSMIVGEHLLYKEIKKK